MFPLGVATVTTVLVDYYCGKITCTILYLMHTKGKDYVSYM